MAQLDGTTSEFRALDEFWCSDCLERSLFERIVTAAVGSEWACTSCGAAYFDAIDLVVEPGTGRLTASVRGA